MGEVPVFTEPGTYTLYFRAEAPNHVTAVTNCTFTIAGWDYMVNMDGATGYKTPMSISDPAWLIKNSGRTSVELADAATRYSTLDATCPNGLKLWQNYVIGRTNLNQKLMATIVQSGDRVAKNSFLVRFAGVDVLNNAGFTVRYRLDKKPSGADTFTEGATNDQYELNVPLAPDDPTGLYVFNIVLVPQNADDTGFAVLASATTAGVIRVVSPSTNMVTAIPWASLAVGTTTNVSVSVSEVLNPNGISEGDTMITHDAASGKFNGWRYASGIWDPITSVSDLGIMISEPATSRLSPGDAFWFVRTNPTSDGTAVPYYLLGRYVGDEYEADVAAGSAETPVGTLCANPLAAPIDLNDLSFTDADGSSVAPAAGDRIFVPTASGVKLTYFRNAANTEWGRNVTTKVRGRLKKTWSSGGTIPAGTGFWYSRASDSEMKIRFVTE